MGRDQVMELVFGNSCRPFDILGRHMVKGGQVISAYHPDAVSMEVIDEQGRHYPMDQIERQPVFAAYFAKEKAFEYQIRMDFADGNSYISPDPYCFPGRISKKEEKEFLDGRWADAYHKLGCHPCKCKGVEGMYFAVWAPYARRVSVVGDFNFWNGMIYPMQRLDQSGIFELFIPGITRGQYYKFEIKNAQGEVFQCSDPYAVITEGHENGASRIYDMSLFHWTDREWMAARDVSRIRKEPVSFCEFMFSELDYPEEYVRETVLGAGFSHIIMANLRTHSGHTLENRENKSHDISDQKGKTGRKISFFEPLYTTNTPDRMRGFINRCHGQNISVALEITPDYFERGQASLLSVDTCPSWECSQESLEEWRKRRVSFCFNRKPEFRNYILTNLLFWIREYHVDAVVFRGMSKVILGNEGRFGDVENRGSEKDTELLLAYHSFLQELVKELREEEQNLLFVGEELPGLAFLEKASELTWNYTVYENLDAYLNTAQDRRAGEFYRLSLPQMRRDMRTSILRLNENWDKERSRYPVDNLETIDYDILTDKKMSLGFMIGMPGKKSWVLHGFHRPFHQRYLEDLLDLYRSFPALHSYEPDRDSLEWINCSDAQKGVLSFIRWAPDMEKNLLFICNFSKESRDGCRIGVPGPGVYELVNSSDFIEYGGQGRSISQKITADAVGRDLRTWSISVEIPPQSTLIFCFGDVRTGSEPDPKNE